MRREPNLRVEPFRTTHPFLGPSPYGANFGFFQVGNLNVMSSGDGDKCQGWEHVSVSTDKRCPTWEEMSKIKDLFWRDDETVIQFHPPKDQHVNIHNYCLHLWRRVGAEIELPPKDLI